MSDRTTKPRAGSPTHTGGTRPAPPSKTRKTLAMILTLVIILVALWQVDANWPRLANLFTTGPEYFRLMTQGVLQNPLVDPNTEYWSRATSLMIESLHMAWIGTMLGALLSFPMGFLAASNVSPRAVVFVTRQILNIIRAIPELILAIAVMLPIFGLGPLAGAMALGVGAVGTLGKLTSEAIEGIDLGPVEAARAAGANKWQVLRWGITPQVMPEIMAFWLYRFEINIRAGAILGFLGAGGIGSLLSQLFNVRAWDRIGITLMVIILITVLVDQISARVRARIISGDPRATLVEVDAEVV
ncbi:phosphonate ABC transporter, permease protein PhnE [Pseudactinotalea sp. Z1739]|uniref:phosphonate ABC transporter, permease protein PhnE n=1 Tax=Pseudactinotalea sp. Z1739 TaxID=3413028 RepID=UPI003C7D80AA